MAALVLFAGVLHKPSVAAERYTLATATTGGTFYPVGVALSTLTKVRLEPLGQVSLDAISSAGSAENINLMRDGEVEFALLQGLYGAWAWEGSGPMELIGPQRHLRSVTGIWQNVEHMIVHKDHARSGNVMDIAKLDGAPFSIGSLNSGSAGSGHYIMDKLGIDPDADFDEQNLSYGEGANALVDGKIAGLNAPAGPPVGAITRAARKLGEDMVILGFTDQQIRTVNGERDLWESFVLPAGTYPGQHKDVQTMAQPNFLAVHADIPEESVYLITKAIYENLPFLRNIHDATRYMDVQTALSGLPVPLHPGAVRYYQEQGITVPEALLPPSVEQ